MRTRNRIFGWLAFSLLIAFAVYSCKDENCEDLGTCPELSVIERTDIDFTGEFTFNEFQQSIESDKGNDLITFNVSAIPSNEFTISVNLSNGHVLKIYIHNDHNINPWEHIDIDYGTYPSQDLEDKWKYVTAVYITGAETPSYSTNLGVNYPPGVTLDVFRITAYDGIEMQCRIKDMTLFKNIDPANSIELDGTFTGAVTFLD